jgi:hypothetical protein
VAPGVKLIGLDIFGLDSRASYTNIANAVNWAVSNKDKYNITAINMSLGGEAFEGVWVCTARVLEG